MTLYRGMNQAALDAAYNNSVAVADSAQIVADWARRSAALADQYPRFLDLRYGERERNRIDYFPAASASSAILVFIHGGYWQMRAKEMFRFLAAGPLAHDMSFASVGYTLAPAATLGDIADEIGNALTWLAANVGRLGGSAERMYLCGWSAGGHLTTLSIRHPAVRGGLAISGIYDLEPIRLSYLNEKLKLEPADVDELSPLSNLPANSPPMLIAYGTAELPELRRQSREYAEARSRAGLPGRLLALEGRNHFSILEDLANPDGSLTRALRDLVHG